VQVARLAGRVFDGAFDLKGQYPLVERTELTLVGELKDIALAELQGLAGNDQHMQVHGAASVRLDLHGRGTDLDRIAKNLTGSVVADVRDGALKNYNLVNDVLARVTGLPGIGALLSANVKPKYGRLFADPDTRFDTLHATLQLGGEQAQTGNLNLTIVATDYGVRAGGLFQPEGETNLKGTLSMSRQFSDDVVDDVKEAKYLLDDQGQLAVPFRLRGKGKHVKAEPDTEYLLAQLARGMAHGGAKDLLDKFLGGKRKQPADGDKAADTLEQNLRGLLGR